MAERIKHLSILFTILLIVAVSFWINRPSVKKSPTPHTHSLQKEATECPECLEKERKKRIALLRSTAYLEHYIENIINSGSSQHLGFAYGDMQAGFADPEAAPKIAAYVVTLSGREPSRPEWVEKGRTFYISNCGGCHGEDGKGIKGTFPDLTRDPLLGIRKRLEKAQSLPESSS
ncbi:cytochrome c oxidase subunit CcoP [Hydrogenimonas sp.]|nr:cytochrome c oxidase subunit CcoP [Hydrogenimonas sp.]